MKGGADGNRAHAGGSQVTWQAKWDVTEGGRSLTRRAGYATTDWGAGPQDGPAHHRTQEALALGCVVSWEGGKEGGQVGRWTLIGDVTRISCTSPIL